MIKAGLSEILSLSRNALYRELVSGGSVHDNLFEVLCLTKMGKILLHVALDD